MEVSRRNFIKITGASAAALALGYDAEPSKACEKEIKTDCAKKTTSICCYCAVGCGLIIHSEKTGSGRVINIEGDSDHPINQGSLCAKGASLIQLINNKNRITTPLYRKPYSSEWKRLSWDQALDMIAERIKKSRDAGFLHQNDHGQVVNRTQNIAHIGSAALDNEECWLIQAVMRALGLIYIEHQARI